MSSPVRLKDAKDRKGILLDTNVLAHFLPAKERRILEQYGVGYKPASPRFDAVKARFQGKVFTSLANVVECLADMEPSTQLAQALVRAFGSVAPVRSPRPAPKPPVLSLYARHGEAFSKIWADRTVDAQLAIEAVREKWTGIWPSEVDATKALDLLWSLVGPYAIRDRGWADVYTAQTAIDHALVVLTEDVSDFRPIDGVEYLVDYDFSRA